MPQNQPPQNSPASVWQKLNAFAESVFRNSDINKLCAVVAAVLLFLWFFSGEAAPLFGGVLVAYLLEGGVRRMERHGVSRTSAAALSVLLATTAAVVAIGLLPLFFLQLQGAAKSIPDIAGALASVAAKISDYLPISDDSFEREISGIAGGVASSTGKFLLDNSLNIAVNVFSLVLYLVLLPLLAFFLLKDKTLIFVRIRRYVPETPIFGELWRSMDAQFGAYIRGKFIEAAVIFALSWIPFALLELKYAFSLAVMIGLSVFVPFVGAIAVTAPVIALAYIQFGGDSTFFWIIGIYAVVQAFDGQVLVPLLFSEVVKLHPVAIFAAIIFFGNLWGVWGVFFAIPLASLLKSLLLVIDARREL
ncbi:MAG: AI-2E family transporter [Betaproteobacteria bacterium]|nr:AI-2E family transporter [Betaproteobacteria bacterium]